MAARPARRSAQDPPRCSLMPAALLQLLEHLGPPVVLVPVCARPACSGATAAPASPTGARGGGRRPPFRPRTDAVTNTTCSNLQAENFLPIREVSRLQWSARGETGSSLRSPVRKTLSRRMLCCSHVRPVPCTRARLRGTLGRGQRQAPSGVPSRVCPHTRPCSLTAGWYRTAGAKPTQISGSRGALRGLTPSRFLGT